jgi:hypothetical protein
MRRTRRVFWGLIGLCLLPFLPVFLATSVAALAGCELLEGGAQPCSVLGLDIGGVLYPLFLSGWFALFTLPLLAFMLLAWVFLESGSLWRRKRRARKMQRTTGA